jgi:hypothetical protein
MGTVDNGSGVSVNQPFDEEFRDRARQGAAGKALPQLPRKQVETVHCAGMVQLAGEARTVGQSNTARRGQERAVGEANAAYELLEESMVNKQAGDTAERLRSSGAGRSCREDHIGGQSQNSPSRNRAA